jgi:hypothetical protein
VSSDTPVHEAAEAAVVEVLEILGIQHCTRRGALEEFLVKFGMAQFERGIERMIARQRADRENQSG